MTLFMDTKGQWHEARPHYASFNGTHNKMKAMVLLVLYAKRFNHDDKTGLTVSQIVASCPINESSLRVKVGLLAKWHYLSRQIGIVKGRPVFLYTINEDRGRRFVEDRIPPDIQERYVQEILAFRAAHGS